MQGAAKRCLLAILGLGASVSLVHCSSDRDAFDVSPDAAPPPVADFENATDQEAGAPEPLRDCSAENKLIYALSQTGNELFRFDPEALTFTSIGRLRCATSAKTFSMAVDRRGTAWVEYDDGRIFRVSTTDASCEPTSYRPGQHDFLNFGMGFAKDEGTPDGTVSETLYIAGETALGRLNTATMEISLVGSSNPGLGELTGTGAGTLYAFLESGNRLVRLDKVSGDILETYRPDVTIGQAWAFAQWGGDFWLFTAPFGRRSSVTRYSPTTDTSTVVIEDTGMVIIGAGSSTCAPSEPPR